MKNTTPDQNNAQLDQSELWHETKPTQTDAQAREMAPTSIIVFPFLKEEPLLGQIYELYLKDETNLLVVMPTEV
jgi:hypothetical protein